MRTLFNLGHRGPEVGPEEGTKIWGAIKATELPRTSLRGGAEAPRIPATHGPLLEPVAAPPPLALVPRSGEVAGGPWLR